LQCLWLIESTRYSTSFDEEDPVERIKKETNGRGSICIDAVGYEAVGHAGSDGNNGAKGQGTNGNGNKGHDHSPGSSSHILSPVNLKVSVAKTCKSLFNFENKKQTMKASI
jgi:hypothetical protein